MLHWLPGPLNGLFSLVWLSANTLLWFVPLIFAAFLKWFVPAAPWRSWWDRVLNGIAQAWVALNNLGMGLTKKIHWRVNGLDHLKGRGWYLVLANHQSWTDIVVLQKVFHRRLPFLKFFLKKELIYVPFLGIAWWALDFPFMKRSSAAAVQKKPETQARDVAETVKACEKFKRLPIAVMNFAEGTRATAAKILEKGSPYSHLLRPKAAGAALVLAALKERLQSIKRFQKWLNDLWESKDRRIEAMKREWLLRAGSGKTGRVFQPGGGWDESVA